MSGLAGLNPQIALRTATNAIDNNTIPTLRRLVNQKAYEERERQEQEKMKSSIAGQIHQGASDFFYETLGIEEFGRWLYSDVETDNMPSNLEQEITRYESYCGPNITDEQRQLIQDLVIEKHLEHGSTNFFSLSPKGKLRAILTGPVATAATCAFELAIAVPTEILLAELRFLGVSEGNLFAIDRIIDDASIAIGSGGAIKGAVRAASKGITRTATTASRSLKQVQIFNIKTSAKVENAALDKLIISANDNVKIIDTSFLRTKQSNITFPSRVSKINNRMPINAEYANSVYPLEKLPLDLRQKYPHSVPFTGTGHPDFSRYALKKVEINMIGDHNIDFKMADKLSGFEKRPKGYTWHHHHDGKTMLLVPTKLHDVIKHTGGVAIIKNGVK